MLVRTLDEVALYTEMGENSERCLRVTKRVCGNCHSWEVVELVLQEVQTQLEILNNVVIICATLVMLYIATSKYLPVFCLEERSNFFLVFSVLLAEPPLEESHFRVKESAMCLLGAIAHIFP